jgi:GTP-binding protein YchF
MSSLSCGIVGLPNAGKSTLFNALLSRQIANVAPYPFCTIEPNKGVVEVPDERLPMLAKIVGTQEIIPAVVEFVDIAGLVKGASQGQGLGNKFLAHIRECSAIVHVVRTFEDKNVSHDGEINPKSDLEIIRTELCLADLQTLEKQREPNPTVATKEENVFWQVIKKIKSGLEKGIEVKSQKLADKENELIKPLSLLTAKPEILVLNINESDISKDFGSEFLPICAKIEMELAELNPDERKAYLKEFGLKESGLERLIRKGFSVLGLQTYLTAGEKEVRAWTIKKGWTAPQAAGVIHTDFEKGFIKAKVVDYQDFVKFSGWKGSAEAGKVRLEGKDYQMQDGDVVEFMFNN